MTRLLLPATLVIAAVGLFVVYTNPTYQEVKALSVQASSYDDALDKAQELRRTRDQLLSKRNTFKEEDIKKLERVLPDNVDNIRLIIDINNVASRHGLSLKDVAIGSVGAGTSAGRSLSVTSGGETIGSVEVGFSVQAGYDDFLAFLRDLEHSLRIVDVQRLDFSVGEGTEFEYSLTIRTYWLR